MSRNSTQSHAVDIAWTLLDDARLNLQLANALSTDTRVWRAAEKQLIITVRLRARRALQALANAEIRAAFAAYRTPERFAGTTPSRSPFIPGAWTGD